MWQIDRQKAKEAGYTDQEIDAYLNGLNAQEQQPTPQTPSPLPTPGMSTPDLQSKQVPDVVDAFPDRTGIVETQAPSFEHTGAVDEAPDPNSSRYGTNIEITNPYGGVGFSGTVTDPSGQYYEGIGNYGGTIGASDEELAHMTPEIRADMSKKAKEILSQNLTNEQAFEQLKAAFPGKNWNFVGHLLTDPKLNPQGVATGSAKMIMGSTGNSNADHTHEQGGSAEGVPMTYLEKLKKQEEMKNVAGRYNR
jgi:hypothetical protein